MRTMMLATVMVAWVVSCGPKVFPKCGEPGVNCPPCTGHEVFPDPCAMKKGDAGADGEAK